MTSTWYLRAFRPSHGALARPVLRRGFHIGRAGQHTSRLLEERSSGKHATNPDEVEGRRKGGGSSEFQKHRLRVLEELGANEELYTEPYPRLKPRQGRSSIASFKERYRAQAKQYDTEKSSFETLYGRVQSIRHHGNKLCFVTIKNETGTIQGMINHRMIHPYVSKENFKLFARLIERGDHISLTGVPTRTNSGDLVIEARELPELLSPTMEPIPETLIDTETKSQKRHLDMLVNPEVADTLRLKSYIMQYMRDHFLKDDFLEVQTPILAQNAGGAVARPFTTHATEFPSKELSLRVAPELWLKRLVIGGLNKVFEIGPSFRNEGIDATHNPEFTMCEFYSAYTSLQDLIGITEKLLRGMAAHVNEVIASKSLALSPIDASRFDAMEQIEFLPALEQALGFRLPNLTGEDVLPELIAVFKLQGVPLPGDNVPASLPKLLDRLAAVHLEPRSFERPVFITHHPACMSPLAKSFVCPRTKQLVSARAELFIDGRELANMYEEENDPRMQAQKLAAYRTLSARGRTRQEAVAEDADEAAIVDEQAAEEAAEEDEDEKFEDEDGDAAPLDKSYIKAMEAGLPPTGGWGCGVERLVMLFSGANRISDCLTFGTLRNVVGLTSEGPEAGQKAQKSGAEHEKKE